jgi:hypothetical protein
MFCCLFFDGLAAIYVAANEVPFQVTFRNNLGRVTKDLEAANTIWELKEKA